MVSKEQAIDYWRRVGEERRTARMEQAVTYIRMANEHAFTHAHPAYRKAEELLRDLSLEDVAKVNHITGGLKQVIRRGISG